MSQLSDSTDPLVGSMLGKDYRVVEPIGFGGMAVVYMVEHQTLLKQFAAKVLSKELTANREARARFTQEAHASSQLDHENIVNISDFGVTADQRPFFVMELLRGQTLDQRIAAGPMSIEEIVAISVPVGRALAYAHAEGIVHRDVKPENIFLVQRSQGRYGIKVVDFGIAKAPINQRLTAMGQTLGSPLYMAPEACRGEDVDHRADIYSFGVLLYLMLCGRLPFEDASLLKVLQLQVSAPLPPPRKVNPELSPELAAVIERALTKSADDRYPNMDALLLDLEAALPPGADRLLIDVQVGTTSAFRTTPFPGSRAVDRPSRPSTPVVTTPVAVHADAPSRRPNKVVIAAVLAVAFGVFGVVFAMTRTKKPAATAQAEPVQLTTPAPVPSPAPVPMPPKPAVPETRVVTTPPPEVPAGSAAPEVLPTTVTLVIWTDPKGATVTLDGQTLGTSPLKKDVPRSMDEGKLVVTKPGFEAWTRSMKLTENAKITVELARIVKKTTTKTTTKETKPPGTGSATTPPPKGDPSLDIKLSR